MFQIINIFMLNNKINFVVKRKTYIASGKNETSKMMANIFWNIVHC